MNRKHLNERRERRYDAETGRPVAWRRETVGAADRPGLISNASRSGISLLIEAGDNPHVGRRIGVSRSGTLEREIYRVVRVQPLEGPWTLVGCRRDAAEPVSWQRGPYPGSLYSGAAPVRLE
ncbi:MAG: hypothetical protein CMJ18_15665 [Phycisphaeraceae bacterium]|nr:hypothetical protein [Phycisphaeraceae bacterium]